MTEHFDPKPLNAFFKEVEEQLGIQMEFSSENEKYPIQLTDKIEGVSKSHGDKIFEFIRAQVDLKDAQIGKIYQNKKPGRVSVEISALAAHKLAEVYALGFFYDASEENGA